MITYQRVFLKTFASILALNFQKPSASIRYTFSSESDKNQKYEYPYNFNREEYRGYIKKVEKAKK